MVNDIGEPISAAHQAIYSKIEESKVDILGHIDQALEGHEAESHHPSMQEMTGMSPQEIVGEYLDMRNIVRATADVNQRIIEVLDGPFYTNLAGVEVQRTEEGMRHKVDQLANGGGPKVIIPWGKVMVAIAGQAGIIITAILVWAK